MSSQPTSPEDLAKRFRIWRSTHRSTTSISDLSQETQIPTRHLVKILQGKDSPPEFADHIQWFLSAFENGETGILTILRSGKLPRTLPPAHVPPGYPSAITDLLLARQREQTEEAPSPYCIITTREISPRQCLASQNAIHCFGCGADTIRFCAACQYDRIAFPGSELCHYCLSLAVTDLHTDSPTSAFAPMVSCHLSGGQDISAKACRRMQGSACGKCEAVTRICNECSTRRVRYLNCGMCLICYHQMMNPLWKPLGQEEIEAGRQRRTAFFSQKPAASEVPRRRVQTIEVQTPETPAQTDLTPNNAEVGLTVLYELHLAPNEAVALLRVFKTGEEEHIHNAIEVFGATLSATLWESGYFRTTSTRTGKTRMNLDRLRQTHCIVHKGISVSGRTRLIRLGEANQFEVSSRWWLDQLRRAHACAADAQSSKVTRLAELEERIMQRRAAVAQLLADIREDERAMDTLVSGS